MAVALGLALVAWLVSRDETDESAGGEVGARIVTETELRDVAASLPYGVYWAGAEATAGLELIESSTGVLIRYPVGGAGEVDVLAIGSYPVADPVEELAQFAARPDSEVRRGVGGREVVFSRAQPTSVYFADQAAGVQVEVYDPSPARALRLARSPRVRPVR